jgi:16S rRNA (guanine966-N2)-methyltransferase
MFDILGPAWVAGADVLDLYAGTGALGIEAVSRGASRALFAERDPGVAKALRARLATLGLAARARVEVTDLRTEPRPGVFDGPWGVVFLDPPYDTGEGETWLRRLARWTWPADGGMVVYERRTGGAVVAPAGLALLTERAYGDTTVSFYRGDGTAPEPGRGAS